MKWISLLLIIYSVSLHSQNYIYNGDFEEYIADTVSQNSNNFEIDRFVTHWKPMYKNSPLVVNKLSPNNFYTIIDNRVNNFSPFKNNVFLNMPFEITVDYDTLKFYNTSGGNKKTTSNDYGFYQKLRDTIKKEREYIVSYRYKMGMDRDLEPAPDSILSIDSLAYIYYRPGMGYRSIFSGFGIMFSTTDYLDIYPLKRKDEYTNYNKALQDTVFDTSYRWRLIEKHFVSDSDYLYINLARFAPVTESKYKLVWSSPFFSYFYNQLDDVRLLSVEQYLKVSRDTGACFKDSVKLRVLNGIGPYNWRRTDDKNTIISNDTSIIVEVNDTMVVYEVMSPFDTASIIVYRESKTYTYDTINYKTCDDKPIKISAPNIYHWDDGSLDTSKSFSENSNMHWYIEKYNNCSFKRTQIYTEFNQPIQDTTVVKLCDNFTWEDSTYIVSGFYSKQFTTITGCDSIKYLDLTIHRSVLDSFIIQKCSSYLWGDSSYTQTGLYTKTYQTAFQCDSTLVLDLTIGLDNRIELRNGINYHALQDSASYQWYLCRPLWKPIVNETKQDFTTTTKASYAVVISKDGCIDTSDCISLYSASVYGQSIIDILIFPNPFSETINIEFPYMTSSMIKLYDMNGRLLINQEYKHKDKVLLDMNSISKGIYYLKIDTEDYTKFYNIKKE